MINTTVIPDPANTAWEIQKDKLQAKFPILTDEDLNYEKGKLDEMLNKVQIKLGKTKEQVEEIISAL